MAPTSKTTTFLPLIFVGKAVTKADLLTPGIVLRINVAALKKPPVEPIETIASKPSSFIVLIALHIEEFFNLITSKAPASIGTISGASTILQVEDKSSNSSFLPKTMTSSLG